MEFNLIIRGEDRFRKFVDENATIGYDEAVELLKEQTAASEKVDKFVLPAEKSKDGAEKTIKAMGIIQSYDAQGTLLGGGKAYLDRGKEIARKDATVVFM